MMHKRIICLLMTALVAAWSAAAAAQNVPEEARRYMARGIAAVEMAKSAGDSVLAAMEFEKAAKLAPDWPEVYYSLGSVQAKMGDSASAIKSYQRYLELAPRSPDAEKVRQEMYKLEYLHDRQKQAAALSGAWKASNGQTFKLPSTVSRVFHTLEGEFEGWKKRKLKAHYLYVFADGTYFTVIYDHEGCKMPILAVVGIDTDGIREVLAFCVGERENQKAWEDLFEQLKERGAETIDVWITDGNKAMLNAVEAKFSASKRQRCIKHKIDNVLGYIHRPYLPRMRAWPRGRPGPRVQSLSS